LVKDFCYECCGRVLDLGCGDQPFSRDLSHTDYVGLDKGPVPDGVRGDALSLPVSENTFDHVVSTQVLEHVPEPFRFFSEIARVLKTGGTALITTNMMWNIHLGPEDYYRFTRFGLHHLADEAGLSVVDTIEVGSIPMRVCQKLNDAYEYVVPSSVSLLLTAGTNLLFYPILDIDTHQDYILVGVKVKKE
jgi:SAM-dependent methyltransferase